MVDSQNPRRCRNICQWNRAGSRGHSCAVGCWLARNEGKFCVGRNFTMQYKTTDRAWCGGGGGPLSVEFIYTDSSSSSSFCNAFQAAEKMEAGKKREKKTSQWANGRAGFLRLWMNASLIFKLASSLATGFFWMVIYSAAYCMGTMSDVQ